MNSFLYNGTSEEKKALNAFCEAWLSDSFWPFKEFELSLKIPGTFLLYTTGPEGWTGLSIGRVAGEAAELFFIFTRPDSRGQGLGKKLLVDFEAYSFDRWRAVQVLLEVRPTNVSAIRLYESLRYTKAGVRKRYYKDGEDALVYEKAISKDEVDIE